MGKKNITKFLMCTYELAVHVQRGIRKNSALVALLCLLAVAQPFANEAPSAARAALLEINSDGFQSSLKKLELLASTNDSQALLELSDLYGDGHFLPFDPVKSQYYLDRAVVTGDPRALWNQAFKSNDIGRLKNLYERGFTLAACSLTNIEPDLDADCASGIKVAATEGDRHSLYALKVYRRDPLSNSLLAKFPYPRVLGEIASNEFFADPDSESLSRLVDLVELGSVKATIDIIKPNFSLTNAQKQTKNDLLAGLPPPARKRIGGVLYSVVSGSRRGWFGNDWSVNDALGKLFLNGNTSLDISPDYQAAFDAFQQCAESPVDGQAHLCIYQQALIKENGGPNLMRSPEEALSLLEEAYRRGNSVAPAKLANFHRYGGLGVSVDWSRAAVYSKSAIDLGNRYEGHHLALQYKQGQGVAKDADKAAYFFEVSATEHLDYPGSPRAMVELALLNESGEISGAALDVALSWFTKASKVDQEGWAQFGGTLEAISEQQRLAKEGAKRVATKLQILASAPSGVIDVLPKDHDFGNYKVLIVANQQYENLTNLSTPKSDAALVGATFESRFGAQVEYLFDADRIEMLSALNRYRRELMPTDNFILYYAGHGIYDDELNIGYWQPIDSTVDDDYTWIDTDRISRTLSGFKSRNALVVADSCFSGSVVRGNEFASSNGNSSKALLALSAKKTRMAITSGGLQPVLDVAGNSQTSAFASNLVDVLNTVDGPVPISSLFPQIRSSVTAETAAWGFEQIPEMAPLYKAGHDGGDFILSPQIQVPN